MIFPAPMRSECAVLACSGVMVPETNLNRPARTSWWIPLPISPVRCSRWSTGRNPRPGKGHLDDGFHETSVMELMIGCRIPCFAIGKTRSGIMAGWRRVIELTMTDEEIERLTVLSRSRTEAASRVSRRRCCWPIARILRSVRWGKELGSTIRRFSAAWSGRWPMGRWRPSRIDHGRAKNRSSRRRPKPGWCRWRATRPRSTAIRMSCGPRGCWPATRASTARPVGTNVSPSWSKARCKILGQEEIKPHKVRYYLERRDAEFEQKMAEVLCDYREVQVLTKAAAKSRKAIKRVAIVSYDEKPGIQAIATTAPDLPPKPGVHA